MKQVLPIFFFSLSALAVKAQQPVTPTVTKDTLTLPAVTVVVEKDPRIDVLAGKKIASGTPGGTKKVIQDKWGNVLMPGYRLQVLNTTDRNLVYSTKAKLYQRFPGHGLYVVAQAPFFKLRFGNFASKEEAEKYKKQLAPMFPTGIYVVNDVIEARIKKTEKQPKDDDE